MQQKFIVQTGLVRGDFLLFIVKFICGNFTSSCVRRENSSILLIQSMRFLHNQVTGFESLVTPNYRVDNFFWCTPILSLVPGTPQEWAGLWCWDILPSRTGIYVLCCALQNSLSIEPSLRPPHPTFSSQSHQFQHLLHEMPTWGSKCKKKTSGELQSRLKNWVDDSSMSSMQNTPQLQPLPLFFPLPTTPTKSWPSWLSPI